MGNSSYILALEEFLAVGCADKGTNEEQNPEGNNEVVEGETENTESEPEESDVLTLTANVDDGVKGRRTAETARTATNEANPLVLSTSTLDGKFNPYYATSAYDNDVVDMTQIPLITTSALAEPVAGIDEKTLAYEYTMTVAEDQSSTVYEFVLKSGVKFADGETVDADDVLFNLYEFLDPAYSGSSTLYSMDIKGLTSYRTQVADASAAEAKSAEFAAAAQASVDAALAGNDEETLNKIWDNVFACIAEDTATLIAYEYTPADLGIDGFPAELADGVIGLVYVGGCTYDNGYVYDESTGLTNGQEYSVDEYNAAALAYVKANMTPSEYDADFGWTAVDDTVSALTSENQNTYLETNKGTVPNVSGITKGLKLCDDGNVRETVTVEINGVDPKAIWNFSFNVAPMHYYAGAERAAKANGVDYFGVDFASADFQLEIKQNILPMGAGAYKVTDANNSENPTIDGFYENGICYFTANDNFLMGAPKIKYIRYKTINSGSELDSVKTGDVHYSDPTASATTIDLISSNADYSHMNYILVDNLGYGYIGVCASVITDLNVRRAIFSAMDTSLTLQSYPGGLAEVIHRGMSKVSWAYPQGCTAYYPFDESGETTKQYLLAAGYQEVDGKIVDANGNDVNFTFTLPSATDDHPAGAVFLKAQEIFAKLGITVQIEVDSSVLSKLDQGIISVWAAAWQATIDPDMFQVYYSDPAKNNATSPKSYGLYYLYENGTDEEKAALVQLNELIIKGRQSLNVDERKPIYSEALDLAMEVAVELPTYQRKNMYVFNKSVIDEATLYQNVTPYKGPLSEIWNVSLIGE